MDLAVVVDRDGPACVLSVKGEVDVYTSSVLKEHLVGAIDSGCNDLVVELEEVGFIDSSGLGVLVGALRRVREQGGSLRLVCTKETILKTFHITGLDKVFPTFATVEDAKGF